MDKINYINPFLNPDPNAKKIKHKKAKLNSADLFSDSKNFTSFDEIMDDANSAEIDELIDDKNELSQKKIETLLREIGRQGERLKKSKNMEDLDAYKRMIKEYLTLIISKSEKIEKKNIWNSNKKQKVIKVHLQIINNEMLELTRIFFSEQQNTLAIAAKIDRIEGLLIDLKS